MNRKPEYTEYRNTTETSSVAGNTSGISEYGGNYPGSWNSQPAGGNFNDTYLIQGVIGAGSGGVVYKAYHRRLKKQVVLKKMKVPHQSIEANRREADILKNLRHAYLPGVMDFINISGDIYTVMDYIEGESLETRLRRGQRFSQEEAVRYVGQLLEALVYLHGQKPPVLHGDIKPSNIMLTTDGNICLIDFNISGYLTDNPVMVSGFTAGFAAPEQEQAIRAAVQTGRQIRPDAVDARSDLYSAGAVLFALLTGRRPVRNWRETLEALEKAGISDGIIHILSRSLCLDPEERYGSAVQMLSDLRNYRRLESAYIKKMRNRRILVGILAAVLMALVLAGVGLLQRKRTGKEKEYQAALTSLEALAEEAGTSGQDESAQDREKRLSGAKAEAQSLYDQCTILYPGRCAPTAEMAGFLYRSGEYTECRRFIRENLVQELADAADGQEAKEYGKLYYLLGSCYDQAGSPEEAAGAFALAIEKDDSNTDYYRDYAISLAQSGDIGRAQEVLHAAEEKGLSGGQISLVSGEICLSQGRFEQALEIFTGCINSAESEQDLLRAYLYAAKACEQMGITEENMRREAELLEQARSAVAADKRVPVLETLAQTYIHLYDLTNDSVYAQDGINVFLEIIQNNWAGVRTYNNIVILQQRMGDLDGARRYTEEMLSRYPEDYVSYKRAALLETALQDRLDQEDRDYSAFEKYYQEAVTRFSRQNSGQGDSGDPEMRILEDAHAQLVDKGWLSE